MPRMFKTKAGFLNAEIKIRIIAKIITASEYKQVIRRTGADELICSKSKVKFMIP